MSERPNHVVFIDDGGQDHTVPEATTKSTFKQY
jgi:hypothetical protein